MLIQLQIKRYSHRLQVGFRTLSKICKKLYYAPSRLTHRRNASLVKVPSWHHCSDRQRSELKSRSV